MKNSGLLTFDLASSESSSAETPHKPKSKLSRTFLFISAAALIACASLALPASAKADGALTITDIQSALQGEPQPRQQDDAVLALSSFVRQVDGKRADVSDKFDDQAFAALQDFAQRLGVTQAESIKTLPKLAEAETLEDALRGIGTSSSSEKPAAPAATKSRGQSAPVEAHYVDGKVCLTCHAKQAAEFEQTLMGKIGKTKKGAFECQNCHGPGSAHVKAGGGRGVGGMLSFGETDPRSAEEKNAVCLACHEKGNRTLWSGSTHETRGLACTNCHTVMKNVSRKSQLKTVFMPDTCFQCHKQKQAQMYRSEHMPVRDDQREGKVTCVNCHNPHGSYTEHLLKKATVNEVCFQCHAEKRGPFLWEHQPVVESCLNCHDPHGSMNTAMLVVSRPRLCQRCHNAATRHPANPRNPMAIQAMNAGCVNCHSQFHGSNSPGGQRFLR